MSLCSQFLPAFRQHFILNLFPSSSFKWHINKANLTEMVCPKAPWNKQCLSHCFFFLYQCLVTSRSFHSNLSACLECVAFIVSFICFHSWALLFFLFTLCEKTWLHCPVTFHSAFLYNEAVFSFVLFITHNLSINNLLKVNKLY